MANGELSRAHVGLALASAFVVLLASGVAISRISEDDDGRPVATGPSSTSSSLPGLGQPGSAVGSGPASAAGSAGAAGTAGAAEQAAPASGEASAESPVTHGVTRTARRATGDASASSAAATGAPTGSGSGSPTGSGAPGGGSPPSGAPEGDGQESPPAPSRQPPEALATASVSAGEGAQGAVVGVGLNGGPDLDLTVGTNQVVGDHPPSEGTGVSFGGRLLQSSPSLPAPPG